eukprot:jgi/Mesvir1/28316/Mv04836-RA.1
MAAKAPLAPAGFWDSDGSSDAGCNSEENGDESDQVLSSYLQDDGGESDNSEENQDAGPIPEERDTGARDSRDLSLSLRNGDFANGREAEQDVLPGRSAPGGFDENYDRPEPELALPPTSKLWESTMKDVRAWRGVDRGEPGFVLKAKPKRTREMELSSEDSFGQVTMPRRLVSDTPDPSCPVYSHIHKMFSVLRGGNQTGIIFALCQLQDVDLRDAKNRLTVLDVGGVDTLINLLRESNGKVRIGAAQVLMEIVGHEQVQCAVSFDPSKIKTLVDLLRPGVNVLVLTIDILRQLAVQAKNRYLICKHGGVQRLMNAMTWGSGGPDEVKRSAGKALSACCRNDPKIQEYVTNAGGAELLFQYVKNETREKVLIPAVQAIRECVNHAAFRQQFQALGGIPCIVACLTSSSVPLQTVAAGVLWGCCCQEEAQNIVLGCNGVESLLEALHTDLNDFLLNVTGALSSLTSSEAVVAVVNRNNGIQRLAPLLQNRPPELVVNVLQALCNCCRHAQESRSMLRQLSAIPTLVALLEETNEGLKSTAAAVLGMCAQDAACRRQILQLDGIRLLWSLIKIPSPTVQACGARALSQCVDDDECLKLVDESFVGSLQVLVDLLTSEHSNVQASICAAVAKVAKGGNILSVMTEQGVLSALASLTSTDSDDVRKELASAIEQCCANGANRSTFGRTGGVVPLVQFFSSDNLEVVRATAKALHQLSKQAENSMALYHAGAVPLLLGLLSSNDELLQDAAAGALSHIRRVYLSINAVSSRPAYTARAVDAR